MRGLVPQDTRRHRKLVGSVVKPSSGERQDHPAPCRGGERPQERDPHPHHQPRQDPRHGGGRRTGRRRNAATKGNPRCEATTAGTLRRGVGRDPTTAPIQVPLVREHLDRSRPVLPPSSKTCHCCGHVQEIGWSEHWICDACGAAHQRDDNAAINLARWAGLGSVGAPVKRGAEHQTEPRPAAGEDTRKGGPAPAGLNNSVRSAA